MVTGCSSRFSGWSSRFWAVRFRARFRNLDPESRLYFGQVQAETAKAKPQSALNRKPKLLHTSRSNSKAKPKPHSLSAKLRASQTTPASSTFGPRGAFKGHHHTVVSTLDAPSASSTLPKPPTPKPSDSQILVPY